MLVRGILPSAILECYRTELRAFRSINILSQYGGSGSEGKYAGQKSKENRTESKIRQ